MPVYQSPDHSLAPGYPDVHHLPPGPGLGAPPFETEPGHPRSGREKLALALCARACRLVDVGPPFGAETIAWRGSAYVYVFGWDSGGGRRLFEVFRDKDETLEPVLAFQYPVPLRKLFKHDLDPLYGERR
ncbi:conserved hypothetical protein [Cupriavidus taiwanensis]|uniref:Uncharacterized protein n=1 Tax=Cupriavidus taiwanensis TaxID=164546 RepID=A0A976A7S9_9BURK|nr:hypothetical protein [Cupriavidus taiwanensis]SOY67344.1 conserved hypothetical protein [Cupriavidus taiwanensis]